MSDKFGMFQRLLDSAVRLLAQSFYDDFSRKNASFRSKAGLSPKIIRKDDGHCCEWCAGLSGSYEYGDRPDDIFLRHRNCTCTVVVKYDKDDYWGVWDHKEYKDEKEARIAQAKHMEEIDKLTHKEQVDRRAALDAEYSRAYRARKTRAQKDIENERRRIKYHVENPGTRVYTGGKYADRKERMYCYGDYLREYLGSAKDNNPEELKEIIQDVESKKGKVIFTDDGNRMVTNVFKGRAGEIILFNEASIGAVKHEYRHFLDDMNNGCPGLSYYLSDPDKFFELEKRGYEEELAIARKFKYTEAEENILKEIDKRKKEIYGK